MFPFSVDETNFVDPALSQLSDKEDGTLKFKQIMKSAEVQMQ